jgi:hypothetical protein
VRGVRPRSSLRYVCIAIAIVCLAAAAYLAFDWADYGIDSTCGNLVNYDGSSGACAHIMRNRALEVGGLVVIAGSLLAVAVRPSLTRGGPGGD